MDSMDKRTAKREACRLAAMLIRTSFDAGLNLFDEGHGLTEQEAGLVEEQMCVLAEELQRRGFGR
jgi:hypothetical protein